ncbi:MAG: ATP-binding cassette domain-containing protein, partial [Bacteroidales bacterium]|nr:ATP-binding cassette domain-containing protein [Bacteroidales bacterium]
CLLDLITGKNLLMQGSLTYDFGPDTKPSAYGNIVQLTFEDALGSVEKPYYFQQRFNSQDRDESPLVSTVLKRALASGNVSATGLSADEARAAGHGLTADEARAAGAEDDAEFLANPLLDTFMMRPLLQKRMVLLSSGEMRRYQLFKYLIKRPKVLVVDNPFIGLDAAMRAQLDDFFRHLAEGGEVQIIMVLSMLADVPNYITHVVQVDGMRVGARQTRAEYLANVPDFKRSPLSMLANDLRQQILALPALPVANLTADGSVTDEIISIRNLSLALPDTDRVLYGGLNWTVRRGEKWALQGRNGAGKSTLLSLICADHPAAYACDISLFGRRRGTGESIWEIKKYIGFVSPEFHRAYKENRPAIDIVASGLHDSVGLYKRPRPEQVETCRLWMRVFGIGHLENRLFLTLSAGEQRLCLLARAFVKDPALLILDEPLHGLDTYRRNLVRDVIAAFCQRPDKTLIMVTHYVEELPGEITRRLEL